MTRSSYFRVALQNMRTTMINLSSQRLRLNAQNDNGKIKIFVE